MKGCKLRSDVHYQGALKQKGIKQGLHEYTDAPAAVWQVSLTSM
jgi:hypothetical protein